MNRNIKEFIKLFSPLKTVFASSTEEFYRILDHPNTKTSIINQLDQISSKDFKIFDGVSDCNKNFASKFGNDAISYYEIYSDGFINIIIFILPKGKSLPPHDHPGMHVYSKLLFGKMQYKYWDVLDTNLQYENPKNYYSRIKTIDELEDINVSKGEEKIFNSNDIVHLNQKENNIHSLESLENSAFLDFILPDYDFQERFCNYYKVIGENNKMKFIEPPYIYMKECEE